mgnify:CR=1 FL=1
MEKYDSYKDSGVEWIGEIPSHWEFKKLKHISNVRPSNIDKHIYEDEIQVQLCNYTDVYYNETINSNTYLKKGSCNENEYEKFKLEKGDVIITKDSETPDDIGIPVYVEETLENVVCGYHLTMIKPISVMGKFIFRFIECDRTRRYFELNSNGVTRYGLGKSSIENLVLPITSENEQQKIISFLDSKTLLIDSLIEKTRRKIELLKEKRTSLINEIVTKGLNPNVEMKDSGVEWIGEIPSSWILRKGSTIGRYSKGNGIKKDQVRDLGFPCVRYGDIYTKYNHKIHKVNTFINEGVTEVKVKSGTLFMTGSGETLEEIGKCVVYVGNDDLYVGGDIIILKPSKEYNPEFLTYLINSECIRIQRELNGRGGIIVHIYSKNFKNMWFPTPSITEQQHITKYLDEHTQLIDKTVSIEEKRIEFLKEYRQSLISEVVTGKRKVVEC